jgi:glutathione S-transferase
MADPILITFPPSLDSELSRFLLAHYGVRHTERRHTFIFVSLVTLWRGLTVLFPLLYGSAYRLDTVRKMVDRFDPLASEDRKLLLASPAREKIEADWPLFNDTLAFASAVFAYYHLLPHRRIMIRPLTEGVPRFEQRAVHAAYPIFAGLLRLLLWLTSDRAKSAFEQAKAVFQAVDARLADGRRYLVGDAFSLSDVAFAVAAAPFVLPDNYGGPLPTFDEMPPVVQNAITEMRGHAAGRFALEIYRDFRGRPVA